MIFDPFNIGGHFTVHAMVHLSFSGAIGPTPSVMKAYISRKTMCQLKDLKNDVVVTPT